MDDRFRFGIEEEFFLADAKTYTTPSSDAADRFHAAAAEAVDPASHELIKGQVEVQTAPDVDFDAACDTLRRMRGDLSGIARENGILLFSAGSHPLAEARHEDTTREERYQRISQEFGIIAQRSVVSAMHIHVEVPDPSARIDLMTRMLPFLPLFLALSVSSPFWEGRDSGLQCYRLTAFSQWPRMGLPELFDDEASYARFVKLMVDNEMIGDASFLWWYIRPSTKYPTIEMRICDACTRVEDAVAIAALYQALMRRLTRDLRLNEGFGAIDRAVCSENIWQVQQKGLEAKLLDPSTGACVSVQGMLDRVLDLVGEDDKALGSSTWVTATRDIIARGTSADEQLAEIQKHGSQKHPDAMRAVVSMLGTLTSPSL